MAFRWTPLDGKKDPPANRKLLIANKERWHEAYLARIEFNADKEYVFKQNEDEYTGYTHYMVIDLPKEG